jgi:O-antigen/teichoic acid export membrane protein
MPNQESAVSNRLSPLTRLGEMASQRYLLSLGAQALVSGFHFGLNYLLLQRMSLYDYGVFAFAFFTLAQFAAAVNNALISTPLTVYTPTVQDEQERANKEAMFSLLNILLFVVLILTGIAYLWYSGQASDLVLSVTLFVAFYAARQYSRSLGYARLRPIVTALGDTFYVVSGIVLVALLVWRYNELRVEWVLLALSAANLIAMVAERLRLDRRWWRGYAFNQLFQYKEIWVQSRWALIGAMTTLLLAQAHSLIITWAEGPTAFAPLAAGFVLFGPVRVALITWQNMVKPELAVSLSQYRNEAVASQIKRTLTMMGVAVIVLGITLMVLWPWVNAILYEKNYADQPMQMIVLIWAAITFFAAIYNAPAAALQALKDFRVLAMSSVYGAVISAVLVSVLLYYTAAEYTLLGIMAAEAFMAVYLLSIVFSRLKSST